MNRQIRLKSRPAGMPTADNFALERIDVRAVLGEGFPGGSSGGGGGSGPRPMCCATR